jgi:hypothetical protein
VEKVEIQWPSGTKQELAVPAIDRIFSVEEGKSVPYLK